MHAAQMQVVIIPRRPDDIERRQCGKRRNRHHRNVGVSRLRGDGRGRRLGIGAFRVRYRGIEFSARTNHLREDAREIAAAGKQFEHGVARLHAGEFHHGRRFARGVARRVFGRAAGIGDGGIRRCRIRCRRSTEGNEKRGNSRDHTQFGYHIFVSPMSAVSPSLACSTQVARWIVPGWTRQDRMLRSRRVHRAIGMGQQMDQWAAPTILLGALLLASSSVLFFQDALPDSHRHAGTVATVRLIASVFSVMTSLALGLLISSAKGTFDTADRDVHQFASDSVLLDRTLFRYGHDADPTRQKFQAYLRDTLERNATGGDEGGASDLQSEQLLYAVGDSLAQLKPKDSQHVSLWNNAQQQLEQIIKLRWTLLEDAQGTIPVPLLILLGAWLTLMFASFAYLAPRNALVVVSLCLAAFLVSAAVFIIIDMDDPYSGPVYVSFAPLERAIHEMQRV